LNYTRIRRDFSRLPSRSGCAASLLQTGWQNKRAGLGAVRALAR